VEKYCREGQAADESIAPLKHIAFWVSKATNTHSEYVVLIGVPLQQWFMLPNVFTHNCESVLGLQVFGSCSSL